MSSVSRLLFVLTNDWLQWTYVMSFLYSGPIDTHTVPTSTITASDTGRTFHHQVNDTLLSDTDLRELPDQCGTDNTSNNNDTARLHNNNNNEEKRQRVTRPDTCQHWGLYHVLAQCASPRRVVLQWLSWETDEATDSNTPVQLVHGHLWTDPPGVCMCCATSNVEIRPCVHVASRDHRSQERDIGVLDCGERGILTDVVLVYIHTKAWLLANRETQVYGKLWRNASNIRRFSKVLTFSLGALW